MLDLGPIKERVRVTRIARSCVAKKRGCKPCEAALLEGAADVPALIAEVERLREALERIRAKATFVYDGDVWRAFIVAALKEPAR